MTREESINHALSALDASGPDALSLAALAARAGVTKGSFYHHFSDQNAFLSAMALRWAERTAEAIAGALSKPPEARAPAPVALTEALDLRLEAAMRALGAAEPAVAAVIAQADIGRVALLASAQDDPESGAALDYARIEYAAVIGLAMRAASADEARRLSALMAEMTSAHWNE